MVGIVFVLGVLLTSIGPGQSAFADCLDLYSALNLEKRSFEKLTPFFLKGDPKGWENKISHESKPEYLSGNGGGAFRHVLADGSTVISKKFKLTAKDVEKAERIVNQLRDWQRNGEGAKLLGASVLDNKVEGTKELVLVMEDIEQSTNEFGRTLVVGKGRQLEKLRGFSNELKVWVRDRLLEVLDKHPDPHPNNVFYRVTEVARGPVNLPQGSFFEENGKLVQILLIDPSGEKSLGSHLMRTGNPDFIPEALLQYNRNWQKSFFNDQLGL